MARTGLQFRRSRGRITKSKRLVWKSERQGGDVIADRGSGRRIDVAQHDDRHSSTRQIENERRETWGASVHVVRSLAESRVLALEPSVADLLRSVEYRIARSRAQEMSLKRRGDPSRLVTRGREHRGIAALA